MKSINLTPEQKDELDILHDNTRDGRVRDRIKAVLLSSEGWPTQMIAQALRLHETTIVRHINDYIDKDKLKPENGGSQGYLSVAQSQALCEHLHEHTYRYAYQISNYIEETFNVCFSIPGLNKWLHQQGFSYKQPKGVPHKFDEEKQAQFIKEYEALKENVGDEPIYFMDATHPSQATKVTCGWIKKGHDNSVETTGSRSRLNIIGALNLKEIGSAIIRRYDTVNSEFIMEFLADVRAKNNNLRIHMILDGAAYHRSKVVKEHAELLNIELHYLPPYSPNLNPIERLWKVMNEHARNNVYFATTKAFRESIDHFFEVKLPEIGYSLQSRINDNFQTLVSAS